MADATGHLEARSRERRRPRSNGLRHYLSTVVGAELRAENCRNVLLHYMSAPGLPRLSLDRVRLSIAPPAEPNKAAAPNIVVVVVVLPDVSGFE